MAGLYNYERLGATRFQSLVCTILRTIYSDNLESFQEGKDGGADAIAKLESGGVRVVQSKFKVRGATPDNEVFSQLKSILKKEIEKPQVTAERAKQYQFVSNYPFSEAEKSLLEKVVSERHPHLQVVIWGRTDLDEYLSTGKIGYSFPELLNFTQIYDLIHSGFSEKQKAYIRLLNENMATFITTSMFRRAFHKLETHHFVILSGPPKAGKTCTAEALAYTYMLQGFRGCEILNPDEFFNVIAKPEKSVLICDDVFGDIAHRNEKTEKWSQDFKKALQCLGASKKLIWTTRSYILTEALRETKLDENIRKQKGQVLDIDVSELDLEERALIVKSHFSRAKLGELDKKALIEMAPGIVRHSNFSPESIRILAEDLFCKIVIGHEDQSAHAIFGKVSKYLDEPGESWLQAYRACSESEKQFLKMLMLNGNEISIKIFQEKYSIERISNPSLSTFETVLNKLNKSFVKLRGLSGAEEKVMFHHPSIKDMIVQSINSEISERVKLIPKMEFFEVVRQLFPPDSLQIQGSDSSEFHKIKMTTEHELNELRSKFESELDKIPIYMVISSLSSALNKKANLPSREIVLNHSISPDFIRRLTKSATAGERANYLGCVANYLKKGIMKKYPDIPEDFFTSVRIDETLLAFWQFVKEALRTYPIFAEKVVQKIDLVALREEFVDQATAFLEDVPSSRPRDREDYEVIESWSNEVESLIGLVSVVTECVEFPDEEHELEKLISELEDAKNDLPNYEEDRADYDYDRYKEEKWEREEEDSWIRSIVSEDDE